MKIMYGTASSTEICCFKVNKKINKVINLIYFTRQLRGVEY